MRLANQDSGSLIGQMISTGKETTRILAAITGETSLGGCLPGDRKMTTGSWQHETRIACLKISKRANTKKQNQMKNVLFKRSKHSLNTGLVNWTYKNRNEKQKQEKYQKKV